MRGTRSLNRGRLSRAARNDVSSNILIPKDLPTTERTELLAEIRKLADVKPPSRWQPPAENEPDEDQKLLPETDRSGSIRIAMKRPMT